MERVWHGDVVFGVPSYVCMNCRELIAVKPSTIVFGPGGQHHILEAEGPCGCGRTWRIPLIKTPAMWQNNDDAS